MEKVQYADIQELNQLSVTVQFDIIKISAAQIPDILDDYEILPCGGALGLDCGPLLISNRELKIEDIGNCSVLLPGKKTTANFLFSYLCPSPASTNFIIFSEIEDKIVKHEYDMGVIIHEGRFTYAQRGLYCIADLGKLWVEKTGMPIPLGLIAVKRSLDPKTKQNIKAAIQKSIALAYSHEHVIHDYIKIHAQELDDIVIEKHIDLYVNKYSEDLGESGKEAVLLLLENLTGKQIKLDKIFIE